MDWKWTWGRICVVAALAAAVGGAAFGQDLSLEVSDVPDPVSAGAELVYTVTVFNNADFDIDGVLALVPLPDGVLPLETTGCIEDPFGVPFCGLGTIAAFDSKQFTIRTRVDSAVTGTVFFLVAVDAVTPELFLPEPTVVSTEIDSRVDLSLSLSVTPDLEFVPLAHTVTYTAEITNNSLPRAVDVLFQMSRPAPLRLVSTELDVLGDCSSTSALVNCRVGALESGAGAVINLVFETVDPGNVLVTGLVLSRNGELNPADNQAALRSRVEALADVMIEKTADRQAVRAGGEISYEITLTNLGPSASGRAGWTDDLPDGVELLAVEPAAQCQSTPEPACEVDDLAVGESATFTVSVRVGSEVSGEIVNSVQATATARDPVAGNNEAGAVVEVRLVGDLNGDGVVDVLDAGVLIAEINDGDGQDPADAAGGGFAGDPFFDVNEDGLIDERDVEALGRLILRKP